MKIQHNDMPTILQDLTSKSQGSAGGEGKT